MPKDYELLRLDREKAERERIAKEVRNAYKHADAVEAGHFTFTSGRHGEHRLHTARLSPEALSRLCRNFPPAFVKVGRIDFVVGPADGGNYVAYEVARHYQNYRPVSFTRRISPPVFLRTQKVEGGFILDESDAPRVKGRKIGILEDVVTTGGSTRLLTDYLRSLRGEIVVGGCIWKRGGIQAVDAGVPILISLNDEELPSWSEKECPYCRPGVTEEQT